MTAIRYIPGHVVAFGTTSLQQKFDESYLSSLGEMVSSQSYELRSGTHWLELFVVNTGEELSFLEILRLQPGVITASLDYIGFGLAGDCSAESIQAELLYHPGLPLIRDYRYYLSEVSWIDRSRRDRLRKRFLEFSSRLPCDEVCNPQEFRAEQIRKEFRHYNELDQSLAGICDHLIAAIDVSPGHCQRVIDLIVEGLNYHQLGAQAQCLNNQQESSRHQRITIVGLTANLDNSTMSDLFGFCDRLLLLADLANRRQLKVIAINMSVDFSQVIFGYNSLDHCSTESLDTVFSIPFFERILAEVVSDLTVEHSNEVPR